MHCSIAGHACQGRRKRRTLDHGVDGEVEVGHARSHRRRLDVFQLLLGLHKGRSSASERISAWPASNLGHRPSGSSRAACPRSPHRQLVIYGPAPPSHYPAQPTTGGGSTSAHQRTCRPTQSILDTWSSTCGISSLAAPLTRAVATTNGSDSAYCTPSNGSPLRCTARTASRNGGARPVSSASLESGGAGWRSWGVSAGAGRRSKQARQRGRCVGGTATPRPCPRVATRKRPSSRQQNPSLLLSKGPGSRHSPHP